MAQKRYTRTLVHLDNIGLCQLSDMEGSLHEVSCYSSLANTESKTVGERESEKKGRVGKERDGQKGNLTLYI